jgi:hypothetical protein
MTQTDATLKRAATACAVRSIAQPTQIRKFDARFFARKRRYLIVSNQPNPAPSRAASCDVACH